MVGDMTEKKLEIDGEKDYSKRYEVQKKNSIWNSPRSMAKYDGKKGDSMDKNPLDSKPFPSTTQSQASPSEFR